MDKDFKSKLPSELTVEDLAEISKLVERNELLAKNNSDLRDKLSEAERLRDIYKKRLKHIGYGLCSTLTESIEELEKYALPEPTREEED